MQPPKTPCVSRRSRWNTRGKFQKQLACGYILVSVAFSVPEQHPKRALLCRILGSHCCYLSSFSSQETEPARAMYCWTERNVSPLGPKPVPPVWTMQQPLALHCLWCASGLTEACRREKAAHFLNCWDSDQFQCSFIFFLCSPFFPPKKKETFQRVFCSRFFGCLRNEFAYYFFINTWAFSCPLLKFFFS